MYLPSSFREADPDVCYDLIERFGFATLVSTTADEPVVTHLPLHLDRRVAGRERLVGHVARANPHWKRFDGAASLAIFHGPHSYVSPSWYTNHPAVPTWNYAVVHVHGTPEVVDAEATREIVRWLVEQYESPRENRWDGDLPADYVDGMLREIVGFEIRIARLEAKFKLSQNREPIDQAGTMAGLVAEGHHEGRAVAELMRGYYARNVDL